MKYLRTVYRNEPERDLFGYGSYPGGECSVTELSADEMVEKLSVIATYLTCKNTRDLYEFHVCHDEFFNTLFYKLILHTPSGDVYHTYLPVDEEVTLVK